MQILNKKLDTIYTIIIFLSFAALIFTAFSKGEYIYKGLTWGIISPACRLNIPIINNDLCTIKLSEKSVNFGIYDPDNEFNFPLNGMAIEHYFIDWNTFKPSDVVMLDEKAAKTVRWNMISLEPFADANRSKETLLTDVIAGVYDKQIEVFCSSVEGFKNPVFIRWGHEMERVTGRYPWAIKDSQQYIKAYQYFVSKCRGFTSKAFLVWSPAGESNLTSYWPGAEYVDYVGLSVYEYDAWSRVNLKSSQSFNEIFGPKYELVKNYNKPVMIAEFGVNNSNKNEKLNWLADAFNQFSLYPQLKTVVFFNAKDTVGVWGNDIETPTWELNKEFVGF